MTRVPLGTVIHGTMRESDLILAFLDELEILDRDRAASYWDEIPEEALDDPDDDWWESEEAHWMLEELFDVLNEYAPPYCYFGALEGDGSDYGFWIDRDSLRDAIADGEVLLVADLADVPENYQGLVLEENDHGNLTLWQFSPQKDPEEIWAVV